MGKALYRTYRSKSFDEVVGQDHITTALKNSLKNGTIAHAYLLTGPRGVGKTTIARLLAFAVNNVQYEENPSQLDIIEIDAASNRRIEEIRSLRDKVHIAPASLKYKVYIIDEVHMLTKEAFNALLKTLEEPPAHVIFILATTEIHKLPDTIISRCIRFTFKPISTKQIEEHLSMISTQEKIDIDDAALDLIAQHAGGSFRDAISLLDQVKNSTTQIDRSAVELMLGLAPERQIEQLLSAVQSGKAIEVYSALEESREFGASESRLASQLSEKVREVILSPGSQDPQQLLSLLEDLLSVPQAQSPSTRLELVLLKATLEISDGTSSDDSNPIKANQRQSSSSAQGIPNEEEVSSDDAVGQEKRNIEPEKTIDLEIERAPSNVTPATTSDVWTSVLESLKSKHNTLYGVARMASAREADNELVLCFQFPFHYKKIDDARSKALIADVMKELGHQEILLRVELDQTARKTPQKSDSEPAKRPVATDELSTITNIFGSSEMLES